MNVVVTPEQHALLSELARLDPQLRSASAFLRGMLDKATPLLRTMVPIMRAAADDLNTARSDAREKLQQPVEQLLRELEHQGLVEFADARPEAERTAPSGARADRSAGPKRARK